jgi:hypothetical protein
MIPNTPQALAASLILDREGGWATEQKGNCDLQFRIQDAVLRGDLAKN